MIIYYHDSFDCRLAAHLIFKNKEKFSDEEDVRIFPYTYDKNAILEHISKTETIVILGVSFFSRKDSEDRLNYIIDNSKEVIWIDWHSNTERLKERYGDKMKIYYNPEGSVSSITAYDVIGTYKRTLVDSVTDYIRMTDKVTDFDEAVYIYATSAYSNNPGDPMFDKIIALMDEPGYTVDDGYAMSEFLYGYTLKRLDTAPKCKIFKEYDIKIINVDPKLILPSIFKIEKSNVLAWIDDGIDGYRCALYSKEFDCREKTKFFNGFGDSNHVYMSNNLIFKEVECEHLNQSWINTYR